MSYQLVVNVVLDFDGIMKKGSTVARLCGMHICITVPAADVFLWRDKKISAGLLGGATAIWVLFDVLEYHLLTLVCHGLILVLAILFLWSNATTFIKKSPPQIPEVTIPEEPALKFASALRVEANRAFAVLRDIASGRDLKKFLSIQDPEY
ncbi:hypothetical protein BUALT_Bualt05G0050700 [Buddleja alternifolia]|uniref:Reticulon-like protein n=1 Tax=Buddleja alternifolia TaxID=168488 RepID=A0AAV6XQ95_9LAMI|nr:hypothetical protein BUALT_Bualt05G0050700 [Buddleja alternifolia]